jgi:uncharacterized membrane protein
MRYVTIGRYQFSAILMVVAAVASPIAFAATYYVWTSRTIPLSVEEPLSVSGLPSSVHLHPGENATLSITINNQATVTYTIALTIAVGNSTFQQAYVQTSDNAYQIAPGDNTIDVWIFVSKDAPPGDQELRIDFLRL